MRAIQTLTPQNCPTWCSGGLVGWYFALGGTNITWALLHNAGTALSNHNAAVRSLQKLDLECQPQEAFSTNGYSAIITFSSMMFYPPFPLVSHTSKALVFSSMLLLSAVGFSKVCGEENIAQNTEMSGQRKCFQCCHSWCYKANLEFL